LFDSGVDQTEACAMTVAAELVSQFLLPEADKAVARARVKQRQKALQVAAHRELVAASGEMESAMEASKGDRKSKSAMIREQEEGEEDEADASIASMVAAALAGAVEEADEGGDAATELEEN
jgi:hypothetical protein